MIKRHARQAAHRQFARLRLWQVAQTEHDVFQNGHMREERVILKDQTNAALFRRHKIGRARNFHTIEQNATTAWRLHTRRQAQQSGFAAARCAEQAKNLARRHSQRHIAQGFDTIIGLAHILDDEKARATRARKRGLERPSNHEQCPRAEAYGVLLSSARGWCARAGS